MADGQGNSNSNTAGAQAGAAAGGAAAQGGANAGASSGIAWLEGAAPETVGYVQNKQWDSPVKVVDSYMNLEKLLGADRAGRTVVLPGEKAEAAEVEAFYNKLGRPDAPEGYGIAPKDNATPFSEAAQKWFHEEGLTLKQGKTLAEKFSKFVDEQNAGNTQQKQAKFAEEVAALDKEWGAAKPQNLALAQQTRTALGVSSEEVDALASVIGTKRAIELFYKIGTKTGEAEFVAGKGAAAPGQMTPEQAKAKIKELTADKEWRKRYLAKGSAEMAEMSNLSRWAVGEKV